MGSQPTSVRFEGGVVERLRAFAANYPGMSISSATNLLVDEGLRMREHPLIYFVDGSTGRRARLLGGPDVWEVASAVRFARESNPSLDADGLVTAVTDNSGVSERLVRAAVSYWAAYPDEIDSRIALNDEATDRAYARWQREQHLLTQ